MSVPSISPIHLWQLSAARSFRSSPPMRWPQPRERVRTLPGAVQDRMRVHRPTSSLRAPLNAPLSGSSATSGTASISKDGRPAPRLHRYQIARQRDVMSCRPQQPSIGYEAISYVRQARNHNVNVASEVFGHPVVVRRQFKHLRVPSSACRGHQ